MLSNWTINTAAMRGTTLANVSAFVVEQPGVSLCVSCLSSIPSKLSFDGTVNQGHRENLGVRRISDYRQENM